MSDITSDDAVTARSEPQQAALSASGLPGAPAAVRGRLARMVRRMAQAIWRPIGRDARLDRILAELNSLREGAR